MSSIEFIGSWLKHPQDVGYERVLSNEPYEYLRVAERPTVPFAASAVDGRSLEAPPLRLYVLRGHTIAWGPARARIFIHETDEKRVRGEIELLQLASTLIEFVAVQARRCGP